MSRRFWVGVALSLPLPLLSMGPMVGLPTERLFSPVVSGWLQCLLASPVVFWSGWPLLLRGWQLVANRSPDMFTLISIGTLTAFAFSLLAVTFPSLVPTAFYEAGQPPLYFEAAAVIITLVLLGQVLETMEKVDTLVIDKTGTLTAGRPHVTEIVPDGAQSADELLALAAAVEGASEHPLARAIVDAARDRALVVSPAENFRSITGGGVEANVLRRRILVGKRDFLNSAGLQPSAELESKSQALQADGRTVAFVAIESAGVTLVGGDLRGVVTAIALNRATMTNIRQNLVFAFGYNALGIPIAAGALYPTFGFLLSPMIAAAAMSASSVSVIANALRLHTRPLA